MKDDAPQVKPFQKYALSPLYFSGMIFFIVNVFRVYFYLGTMLSSTAELIKIENPNITEADAFEEAKSMANKFGVVQSLGIVIAPINGLIIDTGIV